MQPIPVPIPLWGPSVAFFRGLGARTGGVVVGALTSLLTTATVVGNDANTNEKTLHTLAMPGGTLAVDGDQVLIISQVQNANTGSNKRTRVLFGATAIGDSTTIAATNNWWSIMALITRTSATTQSAQCWVLNSTNNGAWNTAAGGNCTTSTPAETLSGSVTISITGQSPTTGLANDVQAFVTTMVKIPAP